MWAIAKRRWPDALARAAIERLVLWGHADAVVERIQPPKDFAQQAERLKILALAGTARMRQQVLAFIANPDAGWTPRDLAMQTGWNDPAIAQALFTASQDTSLDPYRRRPLAEHLCGAATGLTSSIERLAFDEPNPIVREGYISSLRFVSPRAWSLLGRIANDDPVPVCRMRAIHQLSYGWPDTAQTRDRLRALAERPGPDVVRCAAALTLARMESSGMWKDAHGIARCSFKLDAEPQQVSWIQPTVTASPLCSGNQRYQWLVAPHATQGAWMAVVYQGSTRVRALWHARDLALDGGIRVLLPDGEVHVPRGGGGAWSAEGLVHFTAQQAHPAVLGLDTQEQCTHLTLQEPTQDQVALIQRLSTLTQATDYNPSSTPPVEPIGPAVSDF